MTDKTAEEIIALMIETCEANPDVDCYIEWTCPKCGERPMCTTPNQFFTRGFLHEAKEDDTYCGYLYKGNKVSNYSGSVTGGLVGVGREIVVR